MAATLALALIAISGGALLTYLYDRRASSGMRMGTGACTGYALLGSVGTFCASVWQLDRALVVTTTVFIFTFFLLVFLFFLGGFGGGGGGILRNFAFRFRGGLRHAHRR